MEKLSIKQALLDLLSVSEQLRRILNDFPEYNIILNFLLEKDYYNDHEISIPTFKKIEEETGLKAHTVRKQVKGMYDIVFAFDEQTLSFTKVEYNIMISYMDRHFCFSLNHLPIIPRVGENIDIPFAKAALGFRSFFVDNISYTFIGEKQIVDIFLYGGESNQYLKMRKDKASALKQLHHKEFWKMSNYDMERKLLERELDL
ncbi:hypothetical protein [Gillisia sp. JM1]|uniref:hypothetical protein n=1 Tax=Gillisia sp. JM1 TaxID=1283286 RepID=UPI00040D798C|nr:hypothetical protein [Gillisia sp. JM1]